MKIKVKELTRLAFIWAEQDRLSLAEAWSSADPKIQKECLDEARQLREYRLKRWGKTMMDRIDEIPSKSITEIKEISHKENK